MTIYQISAVVHMVEQPEQVRVPECDVEENNVAAKTDPDEENLVAPQERLNNDG